MERGLGRIEPERTDLHGKASEFNTQLEELRILIEPAETDIHMFSMNPLALWDGPRADRYGYSSVTQTIDTHYDIVKQILGSYGILMTRREVRAGLEKMNKGSFGESTVEVLLRDVPRRSLGVA